MKNHSILVERFINELELRNYSLRSIKTYTELLCVLENKINIDLSKITVEDFKKLLHHKMMVEKVSISYINQSIRKNHCCNYKYQTQSYFDVGLFCWIEKNGNHTDKTISN